MNGAILSQNFTAPVFADPAAFSQDLLSGAYTATQLGWMEAVLESGGLSGLAAELQKVRGGSGADRQIIEQLLSRNETKVRKALARAPWPSHRPQAVSVPFIPQTAQSRFASSAAQVFAGGGIFSKPPRPDALQAVSLIDASGTPSSWHPHTLKFIATLQKSLGQAFAQFFPTAIVEKIDAIVRILNTGKLPQTGEEIETLLNQSRIEGLSWKHTSAMGSFVVLHRTPKVEGAAKEGVLILAVLPPGHTAPTHIHQSGNTDWPGEITLGIGGTLRYRDYGKPDDPDAIIQTTPNGEARISPNRSKDVASQQTDCWVGIYWQAEPARIAVNIKSPEELLAEFKKELEPYGSEINKWSRKGDLAVIVAICEGKWERTELSYLMGIAQSAFTYVKNARETFSQWKTLELQEIAGRKIDEQLALLAAITRILKRRELI